MTELEQVEQKYPLEEPYYWDVNQITLIGIRNERWWLSWVYFRDMQVVTQIEDPAAPENVITSLPADISMLDAAEIVYQQFVFMEK